MKKINMKYLLLLFPVLFLFLSIQYAVFNYSPVPFWDTWDGYMYDAIKTTNGDWKEFFSSHNEHRIVISRLLFFLNYYLLEGQFSVLVAINILMMAVSFLIFTCLSYKKLNEFNVYFICLSGCLLTFLSQGQNVWWEFQNQFFLAQVIPLISFVSFASAIDDNYALKNLKILYFSVFFAALSVFTMGNGFIVLLMMIFLLFLIKSRNREKIITAFLAAAAVIYIFTGKHIGKNSGTINFDMDGVINCISYFLNYFGSPFRHLVSFYGSGTSAATWISMFFGGVFVLLFLFYFWLFIKNKTAHGRYALVSLCFVAFLIFSSLLIALSRSAYGVEQASIERYTTPVLMGWVAMLLLMWPQKNKYKWFANSISVALMVIMVPYQTTKKDRVYHGIAGDTLMIATFLNINDPENLKLLSPRPSRVGQVINEMKNDAGFFTNSQRYIDMQKIFTLTYDLRDYMGGAQERECVMSSIRPRVLDGARYQSISGAWLKYIPYDGKRHFFLVYNEDMQKVGYLVLGRARTDVAKHFSDNEFNVGFSGYISEDALLNGKKLFFYNHETGFFCHKNVWIRHD